MLRKQIQLAASWKLVEILPSPRKKKSSKKYDKQLSREEGDAWLVSASGRENELEPLSIGFYSLPSLLWNEWLYFPRKRQTITWFLPKIRTAILLSKQVYNTEWIATEEQKSVLNSKQKQNEIPWGRFWGHLKMLKCQIDSDVVLKR